MTSYFISGASSGLGAEMARQLTGRGDRVAMAARRVDRMETLAGSLGPGEHTIHRLDVTDPVAVERVAGEADAAHGGIDVFVVNAGRGGGGRVGTGRSVENRRILETNLMGALSQAEAALSIMRERGRGHLVLVSSLASVRGLPGSAASYSASKAGLATLGESLRIELCATDIHVTTLRPGYIRTEINAGARYPFMASVEKGAASMIAAIDAQRADVVVPGWPWRPLGWLLSVIPGSLLRRVLG